jgi:hypothetical protein
VFGAIANNGGGVGANHPGSFVGNCTGTVATNQSAGGSLGPAGVTLGAGGSVGTNAYGYSPTPTVNGTGGTVTYNYATVSGTGITVTNNGNGSTYAGTVNGNYNVIGTADDGQLYNQWTGNNVTVGGVLKNPTGRNWTTDIQLPNPLTGFNTFSGGLCILPLGGGTDGFATLTASGGTLLHGSADTVPGGWTGFTATVSCTPITGAQTGTVTLTAGTTYRIESATGTATIQGPASGAAATLYVTGSVASTITLVPGARLTVIFCACDPNPANRTIGRCPNIDGSTAIYREGIVGDPLNQDSTLPAYTLGVASGSMTLSYYGPPANVAADALQGKCIIQGTVVIAPAALPIFTPYADASGPGAVLEVGSGVLDFGATWTQGQTAGITAGRAAVIADQANIAAGHAVPGPWAAITGTDRGTLATGGGSTPVQGSVVTFARN